VFVLLNKVLEAELVPRSLQYHKAKSGTQINEKPLFCFMVPEHLELSISIDDFERIRHFKNLRSLSD